jgi:hypothetical protein
MPLPKSAPTIAQTTKGRSEALTQPWPLVHFRWRLVGVGRSSGRLLSESVAARIVQPPFSIGMMKSRPTDEASMMTIGWLAVLLGVIAVQWADGRFPFAA